MEAEEDPAETSSSTFMLSVSVAVTTGKTSFFPLKPFDFFPDLL